MTRDVSIESEQAVLGAILADPDALADVADLFRPALFEGAPAHVEIATEIQALARAQQPIDVVTVSQRLQARKAGVPSETVLALARTIGTASNVRHYALTLESLWARREAKRVAKEMLTRELDVAGEEFVGEFAKRLSAIETKSARPARRLSEIMLARLDRREAIQKNPTLLQAWATGFETLDAMTGGLKPGEVFTIAARPSVGKTALVTSMLKTMARNQVPVGVFQLEDYGDAVADRTLIREGRLSSTMMRDTVRWGTNEWTRATDATARVHDWPIFIDDRHGQTIHDITAGMRRMVREHGCKVFVLDNLAEVVVDRADRSDERHDIAMGRIVKSYRDAARALGAAPVLIVHLNRESAKRNDGRPRLSDIKNSGEIEDASHVVALCARETDSTDLMVYLDKNRNGPQGELTLYYDKEFMTVRNSQQEAERAWALGEAA